MASWMIHRFGSDDQRRRFPPKLVMMEKIASYCLTRPGSGPDAASLKTRAVPDGDHYVLSGSNAFISGAADALDKRHPQATMLCAMAKRFASDTGFRIANDALQLQGGYGYLKGSPAERHVRDLRVHHILKGTNEIMRVIIARELSRQ